LDHPPDHDFANLPTTRPEALAPLLSESLAPLFERPTRLKVISAWYGHVPFAHWIVSAVRPRLLVELGSHAGVSYSAFCEAVLRGRYATRCFAVDTWEGDEHAGFYGDEIYTDLKAFHDARYSGFSEMLRCTFDEALQYFEAGSIDLLHIDGRHHYEDVRHDFETWRPKLSSRAVVLFHDTNVRERDFGVWRLWSELRQDLPGFEFWHGHGLGVLAVGSEVPEPIAELCHLADPASVTMLRDRFAVLGERWIADFDLQCARAQTEEVTLAATAASARAQEVQQVVERQHGELTALVPAVRSVAELRVALAAARAERTAAEREVAAQAALIEQHKQQIQDSVAWAMAEQARANAAEQNLQVLQARLRSLYWWGTQPLRVARRVLRPTRQAALAQPPASPEPAAPEAMLTVVPRPLPRKVLFISGEPLTPGNLYRCERLSELARASGWESSWRPVHDVGVPPLMGVGLVVLWRVEYSEHIQGVIDHVHRHGGRVAFDIDDLVFRPELANRETLDSIRIGTFSENGALAMFRRFHQTLDQCDLCLCTTEEIAIYLRRTQKPTWIVPNGFDESAERKARFARRTQRLAGEPGVVRIGYAAGSRTHQKDFAVVIPALVAVMRARERVRLVLFRDPNGGEGVVLLHEFPELAAYEAQIEWRDMVPVTELPSELARYDINIAPLEPDNPFCNAKSELKFFEAALVDVPTVASPSGPFQRAIRDGETGFLAADSAQWEAALLRLVDDPALRARMGRNTYHNVLWQFGPSRRGALLAGFLDEATGDCVTVAEAFARDIGRPDDRARRLPQYEAAEVLFAADQLREAEVTVTIASYNYSAFVIEALESVRLQTLDPLDLVVVDDVSPDDSVDVILQWVQVHAHRFNRVTVLRHRANAGLGASRNSGFNAAETPFVLPLDSDNRLRPNCCAALLSVLRGSRAAYAYPQLQQFGALEKITGGELYEPRRLVGGNYIDAMALVAKWAWAAGGGYYQDRAALGWEDYDLWCSLAELGQWGIPVTEVLAEYRVHAGSMVNAITETAQTKRRVVETVEARHNWLQITGRAPHRR
jgi:glycosyltransferase involved in cell wall biosynthesis